MKTLACVVCSVAALQGIGAASILAGRLVSFPSALALGGIGALVVAGSALIAGSDPRTAGFIGFGFGVALGRLTVTSTTALPLAFLSGAAGAMSVGLTQYLSTGRVDPLAVIAAGLWGTASGLLGSSAALVGGKIFGGIVAGTHDLAVSGLYAAQQRWDR